jgi:IS30 family transposase
LEEAIQQLPADYRRAIQLCKLTDCSLKEAARALGVPMSTLKARLHRGRRSLLRRFKGKHNIAAQLLGVEKHDRHAWQQGKAFVQLEGFESDNLSSAVTRDVDPSNGKRNLDTGSSRNHECLPMGDPDFSRRG